MDLLPNAAIESLRLNDDEAVKSICIIGAGPGGLAALKIVMDTQQYKDGKWVPTAFEERDKAGGIWVPAPPVDDPPVTALYDSLTTNLPHPLMCYEDFLFPPQTALFPPAATVEKYLSDYALNFKLAPHIRLDTKVLAVDWIPSTSKWKVRVTGDEEHEYDLLIVANGHYRLPRWPTTPGLDAWRVRGKATHSAWYRHPENMGDTVLVVGAGPSGTDISTEMRTVTKVIIHSVSGGTPEDVDGGKLKRRGRVAEFLDVDEGRVLFQDGTIETGIDHCIIATGYQHSQPYFPATLLHLAAPPPVPPLPPTLHNSTYHLFSLARHLFPLAQGIPPTRLAFLGLLKGVAPLPLMEAQTRAVLRAFAQPALFDPTREAVGVVARYEDLRAKLGSDPALYADLRTKLGSDDALIAAKWHVFTPQEQYDYRDELHVFAGLPARVPQWARDLYDKRDLMRAEWRYLEHIGEADQWVHGVGERGVEDWVELMRKLLRRAEERKKEEQSSKSCVVT